MDNNEETLKQVNEKLERIAKALEKLAMCCDEWDKTFSIKGSVDTYEEE